MASGLGLAAAVIGVGGAIKSYKELKKANKRARDLGFANAELQRKEIEESVRRAEEANLITESRAHAAASASGFRIKGQQVQYRGTKQDTKLGRRAAYLDAGTYNSGSTQDAYLQTMAERHQRDVDWMRESGLNRASLIEAEARAQYRAGKGAATAGLISGIGNALSLGSSAVSYGMNQGWGWTSKSPMPPTNA